MSWNRIEGNWKKLTSKIKEQWVQLTDDDPLVLNPVPVRSLKQPPRCGLPREGIAMNLGKNARFAAKAETLMSHNTLVSWLFMSCTLLMLASVVRMWSHWYEIAASLGLYPAAGILAAVTGAALIVSWWLNTGNE